MNTRPSATNRSRVTNGSLTLHGVDNRNATARRYRDIVHVLSAELGGDLTEVEKLQVRAAATLQLHVEDLGGRIAREENVSTDDLTRAVNGSMRAVASLKRSRVPARAIKGRAVRAYLDGKGGAQ